MKKYRYNTIIFCLLLLVLLNISTIYLSYKSNQPLNEDLKLSAGEITIITPENKTYTDPIAGYYPATYSFDNDEINSNPENFGFWEGGGSVDVIDYHAGHKSVVQIYDTSGGDYAGIHNIFSSGQVTGTIEAYVKFSNTNKHHEFSIRDGTWSDAISFSFIDGWLYYYTSGGWVSTGKTFNTTVWHHVKIEFNCSDDWHLWLNNQSVDNGNGLPFNGNPTAMDRIYLITQNSDSLYYYWIDALAYSWDTNYQIGDNFNEGLLLSLINNTRLEWIGYSLDNQPNRTILGNKTFTIPENGLHQIQIFGNNSLGTIFHSNITYFSVEVFPIKIITPENKTYTIPMLGYYPATYSFDNDAINTDPYDFGVWEGGGSVNVIDSLDGHNSVVKIYDTSSSDYAGIYNIFDFDQATGTIEVFVRFSQTNKHHELSIRDGSWSDAIAFSFIDGYLYYYTGGSWTYTGSSFMANRWYHVRIEFNCSDNWHLWIDGTSIDMGSGFEFNGNPTAMDRIYFVTYNSDASYFYYIDALGYSWDVNYETGDNRNEGLLLSFYHNLNLDWIGYSLDNTLNITIIGNKSIPLATNGIHSIQVFCNNTEGMVLYSALSFFTVDYIKKVEISKTITKGTQIGTWNENSLIRKDGLNDITKTGGKPFLRRDSDVITTFRSGLLSKYGFESTNLRDTLYRDDGKSLYCWNQPVIPFVEDELYLGWGYYSNAPIMDCSKITHIEIYYHISIDLIDPFTEFPLGISQFSTRDLRLTAYNTEGYSIDLLIDGTPGNQDYYGPWTINTGSFLNRVQIGNFIESFTVQMFGTSLLGSGSSMMEISIDYLHIYYYAENIEVDFEYEFSVGDVEITDDFNITVDINETCSELDIYLFNYKNDEWDSIGNIGTVGIFKTTIIENPQEYFNPKLRLRFYGYLADYLWGTYPGNTIEIDQIDFGFKPSAIRLNSPKSEFFADPMSGYYPGTFGFENESNGSFPGGWVEDGTGSYQGNVYTVNEFEGHNKVMFLNDPGAGLHLFPYQTFDNLKANGTIEFWVYYTTHMFYTHFFIKNSTGDILVDIGSGFDEWVYFNGSDYINSSLSSINEWFHVSIDFSGVGNYRGLSPNTYQFRIHKADDTLYYESPVLNYRNPGYASFLEIYTGNSQAIQIWVDAIGYSWDPFYNVGDNMKEGLLLSYNSSVSFQWTKYSLDNFYNVTFIGNTTIPMPNDGRHTLQIFGNSTIGEIHKSGTLVFLVDTQGPIIYINSPFQNATYGSVSPKYNLSIYDPYLDSFWYTIDSGITNFQITRFEGYIDQDLWSSASEGPITIRFYATDVHGRITYEEVIVFKEILRYIFIDVIDFQASAEEFFIKFKLYNETGHGIWPASIQMWWNGTDVSSGILSTMDGYYNVILDPIIIFEGEDPILLNMTISVDGFQDKYYEIEISIDPDAIEKGGDGGPGEFPLPLIITISIVSSGAVIGLIGLYWFKLRKRVE
jgi:hypothetical protein